MLGARRRVQAPRVAMRRRWRAAISTTCLDAFAVTAASTVSLQCQTSAAQVQLGTPQSWSARALRAPVHSPRFPRHQQLRPAMRLRLRQRHHRCPVHAFCPAVEQRAATHPHWRAAISTTCSVARVATAVWTCLWQSAFAARAHCGMRTRRYVSRRVGLAMPGARRRAQARRVAMRPHWRAAISMTCWDAFAVTAV